MNHWCESCARKNLCYVVGDRPKCFVPITNTASGTPYLVGISSISRDSHEIAKTEPQTESHITCYGICTDKCGAYENGDCTLNAKKVDTPQTESNREQQR